MIFLPHPDFKLPPMRRGEYSAALLSPTLRIRTAADWLRPPAQSPPTWPSAIDYRYPLRQRLRRQLSDRGRPASRGTDLLPGGHYETGQLPPVCDRFQERPTAPYSALLFYCAVKKDLPPGHFPMPGGRLCVFAAGFTVRPGRIRSARRVGRTWFLGRWR